MVRHNSKKQIIILRHNGGRLGNQLLLFASIYAFCLEYGYQCINYSFYNYHNYFENLYEDNFTKLIGKLGKFKLYNSHKNYLIIYQVYKFLTYVYIFLIRGWLIREDPKDVIYLPPTKDKIIKHQQIIQKIITSDERIFYFDGWHFRNPAGLKKYRQKIIKLFQPKKHIVAQVEHFLKPLKNQYYLIGVHIRQSDYKRKNLQGGDWYFSEKEVAEILRYFLKRIKKQPKKVLFILCSDGPLNLTFFSGLNTKLGIGSMMEDMLILSKCNKILGANSTFGSFSAFFGNVPFFIFDRQKRWIKAKGENLFQC